MLAPGTLLGPYRILEPLGTGGMGAVYRARDDRLQRDVAIKVLAPGLLADDPARRRFRQEAFALAKLSHAHIATVYDVGEQDGVDYLVMECVPGASLADRLQAGPLPVAEALTLAGEIAGALEEAHDRGVVHRDLKPANIMVTPRGHAKVLDFGIAKLLAPEGAGRATTLTAPHVAIGTALYMSPEQAFGEQVDARTDLWSLGVVLYETLAGRPPFEGATALAVQRSISDGTREPLTTRRADVPREAVRIVDRALAKDLGARYQSAHELADDVRTTLARITAPLSAPPDRRSVPRRMLAVMAVILGVTLLIGATFYQRMRHRVWVRETALPQVASLVAGDRPLAAWQLLQRAERYQPHDTAVMRAADSLLRPVTIVSSPAGATVAIQDYLASDTSWYALGTTPIASTRIPKGYYRWRVTRQGGVPVVLAPATRATMRFDLDQAAQAPIGMVHVAAAKFESFIDFVGWVGPYSLPAFDIDRGEVTNQAYQAFVDSGGYQRREYWHEPFVENGRTVSWDSAMARFRDGSGRPGPATWQAGHYPAGRGDYPVSGISWYEAAAYAAFAGKTLPTLAQWYYVAPPDVARFTVRVSNMARTAVAPVGAFRGVGPFGTVDMAGNVREWIANPVASGNRLILGGAWSSPTYLATDPEALPPFDRSPLNGVRDVRNTAPLPAEVAAVVTTQDRDFATAHPVPDAVFQAYAQRYAYDRTPLHAHVDTVIDSAPDWRLERVSFDAAYGGERMMAYLYLPRRVRPPFQTVVFFPSARVLDLHDSRSLGDVRFFDYVVQSGRAVIYPMYQNTYERRTRSVLPGAAQAMELTVERYKDMARSLDYLATRSDIDTSKIAYLGVSAGSAEGVIYATLAQQRLRTVILLDGGFFLGKPLPGRDQVDFAGRLHLPVLMVNGRYDFSFSLQRAQNPLFAMLGTAPADKRHIVLETPHDVSADRPHLVADVVGWLDKYLGPIRTQ